MKRSIIILLNLFVAISLLYSVPRTYGEEYQGLMGLKSAKAVFDDRQGDPKSASIHLKLIHQTYKDFLKMNKNPDFVVVFIGPSVKLISKNREGFKPEDQKSLDEIADTISVMSKDGIKTEICLVAASVFNVDPATVLPEIKKVGNGWISLIVHQSNGYSMVPLY